MLTYGYNDILTYMWVFKNASLSIRGVIPVLLVFFFFVRSQEVLDGKNQAYITREELFYKQPSLQQLNCAQKST
jgi:hypothetical protein